MPRPATLVALSEEERRELEARLRRHGTSQLESVRVRILLDAADGGSTQAIATRLGVRTGTVSKIRRRFAAERMGALYQSL